jgi:hypothetical protein
MIDLDPLDFSNNFIRGGIDDIDVVTGAVRLNDSQHSIGRGLQRDNAQGHAGQNQ